MKNKKLFKNKALYIIFLTFLCFYLNNPALAQHESLSTVINILKYTNSNPDDTCNTVNKREKYLSSMRECKGFRSARTRKKVVAITFDDGPSIYTNKILKVLRDNDIRATFFVIGENVKEYPKIVAKAYKEGHVIANHTYSHSYLPNLSGYKIEDELTKTGELINSTIGVYPSLFRPPYGACSVKSRRVARNLGLKTILWSSISEDYNFNNITPEKISFEIMRLVGPGAIICLHDGGGNRQKTVDALKIIIQTLRSKEYEFLTIPELLDIPPYLEPSFEKIEE